MSIGERIYCFRKSRRWTQKQLAEAIGVPVTSVANWEQGKCDPNLFNLICLADVFDMSLDYLVGRMRDK